MNFAGLQNPPPPILHEADLKGGQILLLVALVRIQSSSSDFSAGLKGLH